MLTQACVPPFPLHTHTICSTHSQTIAAQAMMVRYGPGTHAGHAQFSYLHTHTHAHTHTHIHTHTQTVCLTHSHFVAKAMMARQWIWCTHPTCTTLLFANTHMLFVEHTHYIYCCSGNDGQTVDLVLTPDMHGSLVCTHSHTHTHTHTRTHTHTCCLLNTHTHTIYIVAQAMMARQWTWCSRRTCTPPSPSSLPGSRARSHSSW